MNVSLFRPLGAALVLGTAFESAAANAGSRGADDALTEFRQGSPPKNAVENRFFLKEERFEITPSLGYVPNNPFVKRYVGGVMFAYHFTEELATEATVMYAPDLGENDLKELTSTLVQIANDTSGKKGPEFQQPLDKMILGATFDVRWAPVYGKLNLIGERVLNFDFYGTAGLGLLSSQQYYATLDESGQDDNAVALQDVGSKAHPNVNLGVGFNFFLSSSVALKIDGRSYLYIDKKPQYDPETPVDESRLYNTFLATLGLAFFFPPMGERLQF
jgi:outer membrane beta-barrel protein